MGLKKNMKNEMKNEKNTVPGRDGTKPRHHTRIFSPDILRHMFEQEIRRATPPEKTRIHQSWEGSLATERSQKMMP